MIENDPQTVPVETIPEDLEPSEPTFVPEEAPLMPWEDDEEDIDDYTDEED